MFNNKILFIGIFLSALFAAFITAMTIKKFEETKYQGQISKYKEKEYQYEKTIILSDQLLDKYNVLYIDTTSLLNDYVKSRTKVEKYFTPEDYSNLVDSIAINYNE